jgi:enoyl-CoA hydratase/carnithine racemase
MEQTAPPVVDVTVSGVRADLVIRRPEVLNAMSLHVFDGLTRAVEWIEGVPGLRVVVVSGEGRSFSSGIDTSALGMVDGQPEQMIARAQAGFRALAALPLPVIAKVRGHAFGAGLQLALACDIRVVASDAQLGILESKFGLVPDLCGTQRLPALVGPGRAKKMIWLAERITGTQAGEIGLAEVVVGPGDLDEAVDEMATRIGQAPPLVVRETKRLVDLAATLDLSSGMDQEAISQSMMFFSHDFGEAVAAFVEGRQAQFLGR